MIYLELPEVSYLRKVFEYDENSGKLFWKKRIANCIHVGDEAGWKASKYLQVTFQGKHLYVHRIIWKIMKGFISNTSQIEHKDRNGFNNSWDNLELVSQTINMQNQSLPVNNTSGIIGVSFHGFSGLWVGSITYKKKRETQYFKTMENAISWRKEKENYYGFSFSHGKHIPKLR